MLFCTHIFNSREHTCIKFGRAYALFTSIDSILSPENKFPHELMHIHGVKLLSLNNTHTIYYNVW